MTATSTYFMLLQATRHWRELPPADQREVFDDVLAMVFNRFPDLRMSHYAVGGPCGRGTDLLIWEAGEPAQYEEALAALRGEAFFGAPLFEIVEVLPAVAAEDGEADALLAPPAMLAL